jgi:hypothetical protein
VPLRGSAPLKESRSSYDIKNRPGMPEKAGNRPPAPRLAADLFPTHPRNADSGNNARGR